MSEKTYLVLTRKEGQKIKIGSEVEVVVVEVRGGRVRLGIHAPKECPILRDDIKNGPVED
jgi:carbon storage regulator